MNGNTDSGKSLDLMCSWKKEYTLAIIKELNPSGNVLLIGFGDGEASEAILRYSPKSITIVEEDSVLAGQATTWAKSHPNTRVIHGKWNDALKELRLFDTIFYNNFPLINETEIFRRQTPDEVAQTSNYARELLLSLESQLAELDVKYTDSEVDQFYEMIGKSQSHELPKFFTTLKKFGYIDDKQYKRALKLYCSNVTGELSQAVSSLSPEIHMITEFIVAVLKRNVDKGTRISSYIPTPVSLYEEEFFFDQIITNPRLDYNERQVEIHVPGCSFKGAIVMVITVS